MLTRSFVLALLLSAALPAQDPRGSITGRVTDKSGAAMPGIEVKATSQSTNVAAVTRTSSAGDYHIRFLIPGYYTVSAEGAGFKKFARQGVEVRVTESVQVDIPMELGAVSETVSVVAESPVLSTSDASQGTVIEDLAITELPLLGGNPIEFALLDPATMNETDMREHRAAMTNADSQWSSMGAGAFNNEYQVDGVSNTFADGSGHARVAFNPPASSIGQFKIVTNPFDASAGNSLGATVNVSTKAGTNQFHGEGHYYGRNAAFDTMDFFSNKNNVPQTVYQDHRFGASLGGPVRLPKLYNGRNRTFFFYAYEQNRWSSPQPFTGTVPTAAERQGDFSALLDLGTNYRIYDPFSTRAASGGLFQRDAFPGNIVPKSRFDVTGSKLANLYPLPNQPGKILPSQPGKTDGTNNYFNPSKSDELYWVNLARVDHAFSQSHRIFVRINYDYWNEYKSKQYTVPISGIVLNRINRGLALDDVALLTPNLVLNVRYGMTQQDFPERRITRGIDLTTLGFSPQLVNLIDPARATLPRVTAGAFSNISNWESGDGANTGLTHDVSANLSTQRGRHSLRWGADFRAYRAFGNRFQYEAAPDFAFNTAYTNGPNSTSAAAPIGQDMASVLMGVVSSGSMQHQASSALQNLYLGGYIQDDFKIRRNLTINVGLRYELEFPMTERYNRLVTGFAFDAASPIDAAARAAYALKPIPEIAAPQFQLRGGLQFAGQTSRGRGVFNTDANNFLPRIGFAWQVSRRTTIRSGYGIFYGSIGVNSTIAQQSGFSQSTPIQPTLDNGLTFRALASNPFPTGLLPVAGAAGGLSTYLGQAFTFDNPNKRMPYSQRWSLAVQELLPSQIMVEASYVGNRSTHVGGARQINAVPAQYMSKLLTRDNTNNSYMAATVANPMYGLGPLFNATITRANLVRPFPQFGAVTMNDSAGYAWYHSLQVRASRRMNHGVTVNVGYAYSRMMEAVAFQNDSDPAPYRSLSGSDRPHRVTVSSVWEIPVGRRRAFFAHMPKAMEGLFGNWQMSGVVIRQAGPPLNFGNIFFNGDPDSIALPKADRGIEQWFNIKAGFVTTSTLQPVSNIRYFPFRFNSVRGDGQSKWDISLAKVFRIGERGQFRLRTQCFNIMNHPNFAAPQMSVTNAAFGTITGTVGMPRTFQIATTVQF